MKPFINTLAAAVLGTAVATACFAEAVLADTGQHNHQAASPFFEIKDEPAPKLIVQAPLAEPLARGAVLIPYEVENFRVLPIFGPGALDVSPRAGHVHVTVDDLPWHWADAGATNTIVVVGLPVGEHKIRIDWAAPDHKVYTGETVTVTVPKQAM